MDRSYYEILGVPPDATPQQILEARRRRAHLLDPSRRSHKPAADQAVAATLLKKLDQAFTVLDDAESRQRYDAALSAGEAYVPPPPPLPAGITGAPPPEPRTEAEIDAALSAEVDQEFQEAAQTIALRLGAYVRRLDDATSWSPAPDPAGYFDLVLAGRKAERRYRLHLKVVAELYPEELERTIDLARRTLAHADSQDSNETQAYLFVAGTLRRAGELYTLAEAFHRGAWTRRTPADPRAFVAYADLDGDLPCIPGVPDPDPDLAQLSIGEEAATRDLAQVEEELGDLEQLGAQPNEFRVLVVDDERLPYQVVRKHLAEDPCQVDHATEWTSFKERLEETDYAVLLLDIRLPTVSGDKLAIYVNQNTELEPKPRIVLHSGLEEDELRRLAAHVGAHAYLRKNCGRDALRAAVRGAALAYAKEQLLVGPW